MGEIEEDRGRTIPRRKLIDLICLPNSVRREAAPYPVG